MIVVLLKMKGYFTLKLLIGKSRISFAATVGNPKVLYSSLLRTFGKMGKNSWFSINSLMFLLRIIIELWFCG
jgi:hypothetical protein